MAGQAWQHTGQARARVQVGRWGRQAAGMLIPGAEQGQAGRGRHAEAGRQRQARAGGRAVAGCRTGHGGAPSSFLMAAWGLAFCARPFL